MPTQFIFSSIRRSSQPFRSIRRLFVRIGKMVAFRPRIQALKYGHIYRYA